MKNPTTSGGDAGPESRVIGVVDDDPSVVRALTRLLRAAGFTVKGFSSGEELLGWDGLRTIDGLVLDVHLGGMTGFDVQDRLETMRMPRPIVFITADEDVATSRRARRGGKTQCLSKPVDAATLVAAIERALLRHETAGGPTLSVSDG